MTHRLKVSTHAAAPPRLRCRVADVQRRRAGDSRFCGVAPAPPWDIAAEASHRSLDVGPRGAKLRACVLILPRDASEIRHGLAVARPSGRSLPSTALFPSLWNPSGKRSDQEIHI